MKPNVISFDSQPRLASPARKDTTPEKGKVIQFLLWTGLLMDASTKSGETRWNSGFLFILALLFGTIFAATLFLVIIFGFFIIDMKEDWRGENAWRQKAVYDEMINSKRKCETSVARQKALIEYAKTTNQAPPPELLQIEDCGQIPQPNAGH